MRALEEASSEGLAGFSFVDGQRQKVFLNDARRAIDEAWAIVGGTDEDEGVRSGRSLTRRRR